MKKSTVLLVFGVLGLGGVGVYLYLKNKKASTLGSIADDTLGLAPKDDTKLLADLGIEIIPTKPTETPYVNPTEGVPLITTENIQKALLALNIDQTKSITELASPNYIEAKKIAGNMKEIDKIAKTTKGQLPTKELATTYSELAQETVRIIGGGSKNSFFYIEPRISITPLQLLQNMTKNVNALGYKVLPNFDIEKM